MKTILHIIPTFATGGAERLVLHYARLLDKNKYKVCAASCFEDGELRKEFEALGVPVFVGSRSKEGGRTAVYKKLTKYVEEIKPDIVHTHLLSSDFFGYWLKRKMGGKIVWISTMHNVEKATAFWKQILWQYILRRADKVICVARQVEAFVKQEFKVKPEKMAVLLNGIDLENWLNVPMENIFTKEKIQLACVGRFWKQKGHKYLFNALSRVSFPFVLHLFGDGPIKRELESEAISLGINDKIIWHGAIKNIPVQLSQIDVVIQPSLWEGMSLVVMEVMSAGRVVIATEPAGNELLVNGETGAIVKAGDALALLSALESVVADKERALRLARNAREHAKNNFAIEKNVIGLESIYDSF